MIEAVKRTPGTSVSGQGGHATDSPSKSRTELLLLRAQVYARNSDYTGAQSSASMAIKSALRGPDMEPVIRAYLLRGDIMMAKREYAHALEDYLSPLGEHRQKKPSLVTKEDALEARARLKQKIEGMAQAARDFAGEHLA